MDGTAMVDLQEALVICFGPWCLWWLAGFLAGGVLLAMFWIWQGLLRWLTKGDS